MVFKFLSIDWKAIGTIVGWIIGYFLFLTLGGFLFLVLERSNDETLKNKKRKEFLEVLASYNISTNDTIIRNIVTAAIHAHDFNSLNLTNYNTEVSSEWNLGSAVFFAGTIVTTIGYGNIAPVTAGGRGFCIFFALIGIPFTGIVLAKIGGGLSNLIKKADKFIEARIKQCLPKVSEEENTKKYVRITQLLFITFLFVIIFLIVPAASMTKTEEWPFLDAFYFCFISITTIGLGDIVPGASTQDIQLKDVGLAAIKEGTYQLSVMLYLLLGLSALTIILNLVASLIKSIAESTLRHGGDALTAAGGKLSVIGGHMMGHMRKGTNAFTNSIKKRADSVLSNNSASPTKGSHHEVSPQCSTPSTELENDLDPPNSVDHTLYIVTEEEGKIARCDTPGEDGIDDSGSPKIISGYSLLKTNSPEKSASTVRLNGSIENTSSVVDKDDHSVTSNGTDREVDNTNASSSTLGSHSPGKSNHVTVAEDIQSRPETACSTSKSVSRNNENCSTPSLSNIKIHQQRSFSSDAVNNNLPDAID